MEQNNRTYGIGRPHVKPKFRKFLQLKTVLICRSYHNIESGLRHVYWTRCVLTSEDPSSLVSPGHAGFRLTGDYTLDQTVRMDGGVLWTRRVLERYILCTHRNSIRRNNNQSNHDVSISQGSVATVLSWDRQNYSHLCHVSSRYCTPKIITRNPAIARIADRTGRQWPSRSSKVNDFHLMWQGVCHFLLVINSRLTLAVSLTVFEIWLVFS